MRRVPIVRAGGLELQVPPPAVVASRSVGAKSVRRHPVSASLCEISPRGTLDKAPLAVAAAATAATAARRTARRCSPRVGACASSQESGLSRTQRLLNTLPEVKDQAGGAGVSGSYLGLQNVDRVWAAIRSGKKPPAVEFVTKSENICGAPNYDVVVLGGTLGIFLASALQAAGRSVCVVERGALCGREQEWNISKAELQDLVEAGALGLEDLDGALTDPAPRHVERASSSEELVAANFGSVRAGFNAAEYGPSGGGDPRLQEIWLDRVLHLGVRPSVAVARARRRFERLGGTVLERTVAEGVDVGPDSARVRLGGDLEDVRARLIVDCMGNASPISRQARGPDAAPSGICIVVGTCARGFAADNSYADLIYTNDGLWAGDVPAGAGPLGSPRKQYYWEAFPAGSGPEDRTTYLFTYLDAAPERASVEAMLEDYWDLLPKYQRHNCEAFARGLSVEEAVGSGDLQLLRVLYGIFPTYRDSPLPPVSDRILAIGDASGIQSPLSFGGFGALARHARRYTCAVCEALDADALSAEDLARVNAYLPNLSATWMFQRAMMVPIGSDRPPDFVNRLLRTNFSIMEEFGNEVIKPFNQDVVQPRQLLKVLVSQVFRDPLNLPNLLYHLGPGEVLPWLGHLAAMLTFDACHALLGEPVRKLAEIVPPRLQFQFRRVADQWEFGSGQDYKLH